METMELLSWPELTTVEQLQSDFSDFYKEVHGFRPRFASTEQWNSEEWLTAQLADLSEYARVVFAQREEDEKASIAHFEAKVVKVIAAGAGDRETAIRWLFDAEDDAMAREDEDYFCFLNDLPYGYFKKAA